MIGIIDYDFLITKRSLHPPSLNAMKMASYIKTNTSEEVVLLNSLEQIQSCSKVYFFSDDKLESLPKEIFSKYDNIELYGKNLEQVSSIVEHSIPNVSIYNSIIQDKITSKAITTSKALQFLDSFYYQAWGQKGERLPLPPSISRKRFYLYDEDILAQDKGWAIFEEIMERSPSAIYTINPIQCHTVTQFFKLREDYEKVSRANKIILDYFIPLHQINTYFGKYKLKLLGEITKNSDICIYLGKNYNSNAYNDKFYIKNLYYCLNLLFGYLSRNIPIKAEIFFLEEESNSFMDIYNAIRLWVNSEDYDMPLSLSFGTKKLTERMNELIEKHSDFQKFFNYSKNDLINTRGIWRYE